MNSHAEHLQGTYSRPTMESRMVGALFAMAAALLALCLSAPSGDAQDGSATRIVVPTVTLPRIESDDDIVAVVGPRQSPPRDNDIRFDHLSIEDGLSQSSVHAIVQDYRGFMWFATEDGLNKYDGYTFTIFRHDATDSASLSDNQITCLQEGSQGELWIGTRGGGLNRLDLATSSFQRFMHDPQDAGSLVHDEILCIYRDHLDILWIGTRKGLERFDPRTATFEHLRHDPTDSESLSDGAVTAIYEDRSHRLWVGTEGGGLDLYAPERRRFVHHRHVAEDSTSLSSDSVTAIVQDAAGVLWIGTESAGLNRLDDPSSPFVRYAHDPSVPGSLSSNAVRALFVDRAGFLWIGTNGGGLDRLEPEGTFVHYRTDPFDQDSLSHNDVQSIHEDRSGVLWVGTFGAGLSKSNRFNKKFDHFRRDPNDPGGLRDNNVLALCEDRLGLLWIGTESAGLDVLDRSTGQWAHFSHEPDNPGSLTSDSVHSILEDRDGVLWVGTSRGLNRLQRNTGRFVHYLHLPGNPNSLSNNAISVVYQDSAGTLWIGTEGGLNEFDRRSGRFRRHVHDPNDPYSLSHNAITCIYEGWDRTLWVGTMGGGLNRLDRLTGQFESFRHDPLNPGSLSSDDVFSLAEDFLGRLYVGTWGAGLNRYNAKSRQFLHFRETDGLPSDVIYGIVEDQGGLLWLSTNRGLSKYDPSRNSFRHYDVSDGLQSNEFNAGACGMARSGELLFGGINGFNMFYPPRVEDNAFVPPVVVTALRVLDRPVVTDISDNRHIQLSYRDNLIAFEFAALEYTAPEKNQYMYRLEGLDTAWVDAGTRRYQSYSNLRGGEYTFRVRGSNNDGVWNREGISVRITVTPPIWDLWQFRAAVGLVLVAGLVVGYKVRIRSIQSRAASLEKLVDERTYEIERRRLVAEGLQEILVLLNSERSLQESLNRIAQQAVMLTGADRAVLFRCDAGEYPSVLGEYAATAHTWPPQQRRAALEAMAQSVRSGQPLVVPNLNSDSLLSEASGGTAAGALALFPLVSAKGICGGMAVYYGEPRRFSIEDVDLGLTLMEHAALAIANAELRERIEHMAAESERSRLARDLHDAVTQTLFSASLIAEALPSIWQRAPEEGIGLLNELKKLSRGALAEMRSLLLELRPAALVETNLADLLRQLADALSSRCKTPVHLSVDKKCVLPPDVHVALYRIAQEALNNVVKHANARSIAMQLRCLQPGPGSGTDEATVELEIRDDGCGFDMADVPADRLGLGIIRERAEAVGAELTIASAPDEGTRIAVRWTGHTTSKGRASDEQQTKDPSSSRGRSSNGTLGPGDLSESPQ